MLPILGAVPDGMMTFFSGLGPAEEVQKQVHVGVGVLAGSTVMLLTFPWFIAILYGRVPVGSSGKVDYTKKEGRVGICSGGICYGAEVVGAAKVMILTTLLYFIIQIPATLQENGGGSTQSQADAENFYAGVTMVAAMLAFCGYLVYCFIDANEDKQLEAIIRGISEGSISLEGAMTFFRTQVKPHRTTNQRTITLPKEDMAKFKKILKPFFNKYDDDRSGQLEFAEFKRTLADFHQKISEKSIYEKFTTFDFDHSGTIGFDEFAECVLYVISDKRYKDSAAAKASAPTAGDDDDGEEEHVPDDIAKLPPSQQQSRILMRAGTTIGIGTVLILIFSDPLVDCLSEWGKRLDISPFYVSFLLAPFASNASELICAASNASKKTTKSITLSLMSLLGAACMNNTFVLAIFMGLVYFKNLAWQFTAETIAIVVVQWTIGWMTMKKNRMHTVFTGTIILLMYPGCLLLVWALENFAGLD